MQSLAGAVDIHIHTAPDIFPRCVTAATAAEAARAARMGAIVVKSHSTDTAARAEVAREQTGFPVYGGVALNAPVGGLNPYAVLETARQGGRVVWMPTISARYFVTNGERSPTLASSIPPGFGGYTILRDGRLIDECRAILDLVAEYDLMLASGHLATDETRALFEAAADLGIKRLVVTHPHADFVRMAPEDAKEIADLGAFVEFTDVGTIEDRADYIRAVGPDRCVLSTDGGRASAPPPVDRLQRFADGLAALGFSANDLHQMTAVNPSRLLGRAEDTWLL